MLDSFPATFAAYVETAEGVALHPYHLGTDLRVAEGLVFEMLRRPGVRTVCLRKGTDFAQIYDDRDLPEYVDTYCCEDPLDFHGAR